MNNCEECICPYCIFNKDCKLSNCIISVKQKEEFKLECKHTIGDCVSFVDWVKRLVMTDKEIISHKRCLENIESIQSI